MATLESRIVALAQAMGTDVKALNLLVGNLPSLTTTAKNNLVAAINEVAQAVANSSGIDDGATSGSSTWSSSKINSAISGAVSDLVGGAGSALDTLKELADALGNDPSFATTIATQLANRVRYDDAQVLTNPQKAQARSNIGAFGADEIGDPDRDLAAAYAAAKV